MRKLMIASVLALVLGVAAPVRADITLTSAVAAAWFPRSVDAGLHDIAHQRVLQISACSSCMNHDGMHAGTAEVLGYNSGYPNPISTVIAAWRSSPVHDAILSDRSYGRIGCAERSLGQEHWFVCVLATGGWTGASSGSGDSGRFGGSGATFGIPDTALPPPR